MTNEINRRLNLIKKISYDLYKENYGLITIGYGGSVATMTASNNSDIDLTYFINKENFSKILMSKSFINTFPSTKKISIKTLLNLYDGKYDIFCTKSSLKGIDIGLHLCSTDIIKKITKLQQLVVHRFRVHYTPINIGFNSFDNNEYNGRDGNDFIIVPFKNKRVYDGTESDIPTLSRVNKKPYFGLHIDILFTTKILEDPLEIESLQIELHRNLYNEWKKGDYLQDMYGFLRKRRQIPNRIINEYRMKI